MTEIERIVLELEREHSGDAWHGSPLRLILEGVDHRQAALRPLGKAQTIWQTVLQIISWKNELLGY